MPDPTRVVDVDGLVEDLRLVTRYASSAGLLRDKTVLATLEAADKTIAKDSAPDVYAITSAINDVSQLIAPMTIADLKFHRDPFLDSNQKRAEFMQAFLTACALIALLLIGAIMESLRSEQEVLLLLQQVQDARPQYKLTALRRLVQYEKPLDKSNVAVEAYYQRLSDLVQLSSKMSATYLRAQESLKVPFVSFLPTSIPAPSDWFFAKKAPPARPDPPVAQAGISQVSGGAEVTNYIVGESSGLGDPGVQKCDDEQGNVRLPPEAANYPTWLKAMFSEALADSCFQQRISSDLQASGGRGAMLEESYDFWGNVPKIKDRVSERVNWALPFLYGILGSIIFVMRNVASLRSPAMGWLPVIMRIGLGGIAGIVIGWFSGGTANSVANNASVSLPFALAFLTGYGIDVLFNLLDKLNRAMGEASAKKA